MIAISDPTDWPDLLRVPGVLLSGLAGLALLLAVVELIAVLRRARRGRPFGALLHGLFLLIGLALCLLFAGSAWMLRGYRLLAGETDVATLDARILSPQHWLVTLHLPDGSDRAVELYGDAWRIEALVVKWKLPATLAGVPPVYRLDRLSGRYDDADQEMTAPRTVVDFARGRPTDLVNLYRHHPDWFPMVDTEHGSGTYLPLVDGGHYTVRLMRTGALVARPDAATAARMAEAW